MSLVAGSCVSRLQRVDQRSTPFPFLQDRAEPTADNPCTRDECAMTTTLLLRIASVVSLVFTAGHSLGGLRKWSPMGDNDVLRAMTAVRFDTMGANRSYLDFFLGFGWS